jgi:Ca2+-binding EF-hand superfamily protein
MLSTNTLLRYCLLDLAAHQPVDDLRKVLDGWIIKTQNRISKTEELLGSKLQGLDLDGDGQLHAHDIEEFVQKILKHPNPEAAVAFVNMLDRDKDGVVSVAELLKYIEDRKASFEENPIK